MSKRDLFAELKEGFSALAAERQGKLTLRQHQAESKVIPVVTKVDVLSLRNRLNVSRAVFADYLRTNPRTVENWEQGRAKPNAQAALLIQLVDKFPETLEHIAAL
jgi:putative transcriptional regulator